MNTEQYNLAILNAFTSRFWHTEASAQKSANHMTKLRGRYFTSIKGKPHDKNVPNECWAVTDRFASRLK